ncbi:hypothetical protein WME76_24855 [Sorangium sp. So ce119]|uniref:hypothetical protein n=1 Tax=Sorangium sp. So ce119 TaxID=3133279 RepID=UPI003F63F3F1
MLKMRYALGDFQEVPDRHRGDFGIEGFSRDGRAYQCYAPLEPLATNARYENQRDKIATDIKKFIDNKDDLVKVFGPTKIARWVLAVPTFDSGPLVQHAEKKAAEVRAASLPYVASDFCISIVTEDDFEAERAKLLRLGLEQLHIAPKVLQVSDTADWATQNSSLLGTLESKLARVPTFTSAKRGTLRERLLQHYLQGQDILDTLKNKYSDVFEAAIRTKGAREAFLETHCLMAEDTPQRLLSKTLEDFKRELMKFEMMTEQMAEALAYEALADWLMRCPLDFPQEAP